MLSFSHSSGITLQVKEELPSFKMSFLNFSKYTEQRAWEVLQMVMNIKSYECTQMITFLLGYRKDLITHLLFHASAF